MLFMKRSSVYKFVSSLFQIWAFKTKSPILHLTEEMGLYFFCNPWSPDPPA